MGKGRKIFDSNAQLITMLTLVIQFLHCLLSLSCYLDWVRHQEDVLGRRIVKLYLALVIIAIISFLLFSSAFYMWAWRYASCEETAQKRRIWGIAINLLFADFPLFCTEVDIMWNVGFATPLQVMSFFFTIFSFGYSAIRVWFFAMVRFIKRSQPPERLGAQPGELPTTRNIGGLISQPHEIHDPSLMHMSTIDQGRFDHTMSDEYDDGYSNASRAGGIIPRGPSNRYEAAPTPAGEIIPPSAMNFVRENYEMSARQMSEAP